MKNLLLIGDSIRLGYDKSVKKTLDGRANVIFPEENCRFASYVLRYFHEYIRDVKGEDIDVVHYYTPMGTEAFTNQVLSFVCPALGIQDKLEYREEMYTDKPIGI